MNAEKHNLDRIYFGGGFIRGHAATISTLSYAIRFWSKGKKRALFLRHEGYVGAIGAWLKNLSENGGSTPIRRGDVPLPSVPTMSSAEQATSPRVETVGLQEASSEGLVNGLEGMKLASADGERFGAGEAVEVDVQSDDR